jgi:hypothetical protein
MLPAGFEPTIPASERTQNHALDRAATGVGPIKFNKTKSYTTDLTFLPARSTTPSNAHATVAVQIQESLTSAPDAGKWFASRTTRLIPAKG